jgi:two-component system, OmpR family, response regulator
MRVLVVEDEPRMARLIRQGLAEEGHQVDLCGGAVQAVEQAQQVAYDVVVLDWGLPDGDGVSVVRELRQRGCTSPVLMLTARGSTGEKVTGLRAGADDYLVKPFDFDELLARLDVLCRRVAAAPLEAQVGDLTVVSRRRVLVRGEVEVALTGREFSLFEALSREAGDAVSRTRLLSQVWGSEFEGTGNVLDVYVGYLRTKLGRLGSRRVTLESVRGIGYRLQVGPP